MTLEKEVKQDSLSLSEFNPGQIPGLNELKLDKDISLLPFGSKYCLIYNSTNTNHTTSGSTQEVAFDTSITNDAAMAATANKITITEDGAYFFYGNLQFSNSAGGNYRRMIIQRSSPTSATYFDKYIDPQAHSNPDTINGGTLAVMTSGDEVRMLGDQDSGGALQIDQGSQDNTFLLAFKI